MHNEYMQHPYAYNLAWCNDYGIIEPSLNLDQLTP